MTGAAQRHGGTAVVEVLRAKGVTQFFNVPGESFLPILDALRTQDQIRVVTNRHESGAAFAAEGFAKVAGRPAVCMGTRGPGASNLAIGIQLAHYDRTPLIALIGLVPTALQGMGAFQDVDVPAVFGTMTKSAVVVPSRAELESVLGAAIDQTIQGRNGPVAVGFPSDVLTAAGPVTEVAGMPARSEGDAAAGKVVDLIEAAAHPVFVMSTAAVRGELAADVGAFALSRDIPVVCGWRRFSAFDNGHSSFAGSLGLGMSPSVREVLDRADLVVAFGPLEQITVDSGRLNRAGLVVVSVDTAHDRHLAGRLAATRLVEIVASPDAVARALSQDVRPPRKQAGAPKPRPPGNPGNVADAVVAILDETIAGDAIAVSDAGDFAHSILRCLRFDRDRSFLGPVIGAMGYGLPAAIGARLAAPSRPVYCLAGDGGLLMTAGEMETAVRSRLELTAIVFNNWAYGTIRSRQAEDFPGKEFATDLGQVRFADLARSMGWTAWSVGTPDEFAAALAKAEDTAGCRLIEVDSRG